MLATDLPADVNVGIQSSLGQISQIWPSLLARNTAGLASAESGILQYFAT